MPSVSRRSHVYAAALSCALLMTASLSHASVVALAATRSASATPYGFSALRVRFDRSLMSDDGFLIAAYAQAYGVTTLYVPLAADDVRDLLEQNPTAVANLAAMTRVANVYVVSGDPTWLATPTTVPPDVRSLAAVARAYPEIAGVLYDVDPSSLPQWKGADRPTLSQAFVTLVATLARFGHANAFRDTRVAVAAEEATERVGSVARAPSIVQAIEATTGVRELLVATPGDSAASQLQALAPALAQLSLPFALVARTSAYSGRSYSGATPSYLTANLAQVAASASSANANAVGVAVDGWNDSGGGIVTVLPQPPVHPAPLPPGPLVPAAGSAYLGGFVNPNGTGQTPAQTISFERSIGRTLAIDLHYHGWTAAFPTQAETDDVAHGRIPLVAWNCGDTDQRVANGLDDATIVARAKALKAFGSPIIVRWFWEMNLGDAVNGDRPACWDARSDLPGGSFAPRPYIAAYRHIHDVFARLGVTNVVWEWCVSKARGGAAQFYPGDDAVDWIGLDAYDLDDTSLPATLDAYVGELSQFQTKPLMISETGAHALGQPTYVTGAASVLRLRYPWIRGFVYFDANTTNQAWALDGSGLADFATFARDPYMGAMLAP